MYGGIFPISLPVRYLYLCSWASWLFYFACLRLLFSFMVLIYTFLIFSPIKGVLHIWQERDCFIFKCTKELSYFLLFVRYVRIPLIPLWTHSFHGTTWTWFASLVAMVCYFPFPFTFLFGFVFFVFFPSLYYNDRPCRRYLFSLDMDMCGGGSWLKVQL